MIEQKFIGGEPNADFAKRVAVRNGHVKMCNGEKAKFKAFTATVKKTVDGHSRKREFGDFKRLDGGLMSTVGSVNDALLA